MIFGILDQISDNIPVSGGIQIEFVFQTCCLYQFTIAHASIVAIPDSLDQHVQLSALSSFRGKASFIDTA